jgi:hypothetical protein
MTTTTGKYELLRTVHRAVQNGIVLAYLLFLFWDQPEISKAFTLLGVFMGLLILNTVFMIASIIAWECFLYLQGRRNPNA